MNLKSIFLNSITSKAAYWFIKRKIKNNFLKTKHGLLDLANQSMYIKCLAATKFYERREVELTRKHLRRDIDVIELGASIGFVSLAIAKHTNKKIVSVEANPLLISNLNRTKRKNDLHHVFFVNAAVAYSGKKEISFIVDHKNLGSKIGNQPDNMNVPAVTLAELKQVHQIKEYALVSDIEGAEIDFVWNETNEQVIDDCKQIIIELHDTTYKQRFFRKEQIATMIAEKFRMKVVDQDATVWVFEKINQQEKRILSTN